MSDETNCAIHAMRRLSCWRVVQTKFGPGTSPSSEPSRSGPYYYLYVLLDIFSRYVVGWMLAHRESGKLAAKFIEGNLRQTKHQARTAHCSRRSRLGTEIKNRRAALR